MPLVVSMLSAPEKATVVLPVWLVMLMAFDAPVVRLLVEPEKVKLLESPSRTMALPLAPLWVRLPESVTAPVA